MVMYATASDLASYMQRDLDTATATLALTLASGEFSRAAGVMFAATTTTYQTTGTIAASLSLPYRPITAVSAVRINGVAVTGWSLIGSTLYRTAGFGSGHEVPPSVVEVDLTHGYTVPGDDVRAAVLETAAQTFGNPSAVVQETIDDYSVRYGSTGGVRLSPHAAELARDYHGPVFA